MLPPTSNHYHPVYPQFKNFDWVANPHSLLDSPCVRDRRVCTQLYKHFNEYIESIKQSLDHDIRNEAIAIEKYQFILNYKLNRPVKIRETGIIVQSQLFWLGDSSDGVICDKKIQEIGLLQIKLHYNKSH